MYYVYIIRCHDNSLYTGITKDICKRMKEHYYKTKNCAKYTRNRDIISLDALWIAEDRSHASKLEYHIKHLTKQQKEKIIQTPSLIDSSYIHQIHITLQLCLDNTTIKYEK